MMLVCEDEIVIGSVDAYRAKVARAEFIVAHQPVKVATPPSRFPVLRSIRGMFPGIRAVPTIREFVLA